MIIWIMMVLDMIALGAVSLAQFHVAYINILLFYAGGYLILKLAIFRDVMSGIDAVFGIYAILVGLFHFSSFFYWIMLGWFLYKLAFTWTG